jgi:predicted RNA binding protein YcfA (HicA-like mRNA interferase family)
MPKLPRLTAREICTVLEKLGFSIARQSGSHIIYKILKASVLPCHFIPQRFSIPKY